MVSYKELKDIPKLLAIDPSLSCSGWALFDRKNQQLIGVGKITSLSPDYSMAVRIAELQKSITGVMKKLCIGTEDVVVCEDATTMVDPKVALLLEQIRTIYDAVARMRGARVPGRINPRSVQFEVMGLRGSQIARVKVKDVARHTAIKLYGKNLEEINFDISAAGSKKNQDIFDAVLIGHLALTRLQQAEKAGEKMEALFEAHKRVTKQALKSVTRLRPGE